LIEWLLAQDFGRARCWGFANWRSYVLGERDAALVGGFRW